MNNSLNEAMRGCGELLTGISEWFNQCLTFLRTECLLSRDGMIPEFVSEHDLTSAPGRLHWRLSDPVLSKYGKYTVCVDLVLNEPEIDTARLPFIAWQISASSEPRKRKLAFYPYNQYPHLNPDVWGVRYTGESAQNSTPPGLFYRTETSGTGTFNRNCVIYHPVYVLEIERADFFPVLVLMIEALQYNRFRASNYAAKMSAWLLASPDT